MSQFASCWRLTRRFYCWVSLCRLWVCNLRFRLVSLFLVMSKRLDYEKLFRWIARALLKFLDVHLRLLQYNNIFFKPWCPRKGQNWCNSWWKFDFCNFKRRRVCWRLLKSFNRPRIKKFSKVVLLWRYLEVSFYLFDRECRFSCWDIRRKFAKESRHPARFLHLFVFDFFL